MVNEEVEKMERFLREGVIRILPPQQCPVATNLHYNYNFKSMICAYTKGVDTCQVIKLNLKKIFYRAKLVKILW